MGIFSRRRTADLAKRVPSIHFFDEPGLKLVQVVGESHYQEALHLLCGRKADEAIHFECIAGLVPEPSNPHDPNAVMIQIEGRCVGYLSRHDAVAYSEAVRLALEADTVISCSAMIAGHGPQDAETRNLGVFLHLPKASETITGVQEFLGRSAAS